MMYIGTLFGILMAIPVVVGWGFLGMPTNDTFFALLMVIVGCTFFLIAILAHLFIYTPLQRAEENLTPQIIRLFRKNMGLQISMFYLLLFPIFSFALAFKVSWGGITPFERYIFAGWLFLSGVSIDILQVYLKKSVNYLNPFHVLSLFEKEANFFAKKGSEENMCNWIDSLSETSLKAMDRSSITLCSNSINSLPIILKSYFQTCKKKENSEGANSSENKASYTLFFVCDRLEILYNRALHYRYESICSAVVTVLGKIAIHVASYHPSFATHPLRYIVRFNHQPDSQQLGDLNFKADCVLIEVGRALIEDVEGDRPNLKEPLLTIIAHLEEGAKETFRRDKSLNIEKLIKPLRDIKDLFKSPKIMGHPDLLTLNKQMDSIMGEFSALSQIMSRIQDSSATSTQTSPSDKGLNP